jgi:hypothetical protein
MMLACSFASSCEDNMHITCMHAARDEWDETQNMPNCGRRKPMMGSGHMMALCMGGAAA